MDKDTKHAMEMVNDRHYLHTWKDAISPLAAWLAAPIALFLMHIFGVM